MQISFKRNLKLKNVSKFSKLSTLCCDCQDETHSALLSPHSSSSLHSNSEVLKLCVKVLVFFVFFLFLYFNFAIFLLVVIFKIPYPGWTTAKIGSYALTGAFEKVANMPVVDVTVTGEGR